MVRDKIFKMRCTEYEKELIKAITKKGNQESNVLSESDIVRIAIDTFAKKYLSMSELEELKKQYMEGENNE